MILILTNRRDVHADVICDGLKKWRADYLRINTEDFPAVARASMRYGQDSTDMLWLQSGESYNLSTVETVVFRRPEFPNAQRLNDEGSGEIVRVEAEHFLWGILRLLQGKRWVNPLSANRDSDFKPYNLQRAAAHGFITPKTLYSNNASHILKFASECNGRLIYKPFDFYTVTGANDSRKTVYTNLISSEDINGSIRSLESVPGIFQEYIEKELEIRLTVIGGRVFACSIDSQKSSRGKVDWRRYEFRRDLYAAFTLPSDIEHLAISYVKALGLIFGCIDMILTPAGQYVFLEINPNGQWLWVDNFTHMPLLETYLDLITSRI
ncbi:MvdC/MvdD family ATP grasp protein [Granulicella sp. S190]|uniref:MvdC/MvdD family ATP grasp protein n=1 Tax=Granulicella sp. S190 TaxID=1747226 RepID=UPI00352B14FC